MTTGTGRYSKTSSVHLTTETQKKFETSQILKKGTSARNKKSHTDDTEQSKESVTERTSHQVTVQLDLALPGNLLFEELDQKNKEESLMCGEYINDIYFYLHQQEVSCKYKQFTKQ